ncbi:gluconokinase [Sphaerotilus sp.]|uniref:gluconokinase n=1 Tax=Sphaerotilus sp. TaxID=2093942 RepID=UPI002ACD8B32|nr:gluconokinase [Sphaerotilus sp.]MDZ7856525.1 gluconokinase [Sphaerotilus sp.]
MPSTETPRLPVIVVMGVSGCGKSTFGLALAQALGVPYIEGDALHPPRNVALMAAGTPLTDADRAGWLDVIGDRLAQAGEHGAVVACSALRRVYRDRLRTASPGLRLVYLDGDPALLAERIGQRTGHYMPPALLPSQLQTLEPPDPDEAALTFDIAQPPEALVRRALQALR